MRSDRARLLYPFVLALLFVAGRLAAHAADATETDERPAAAGRIVARINSEPVYEERVKAEIKKSAPFFRAFGKRADDPDALKPMERHALDTIIDEVLLAQESQKLKIDDIEQRVDRALAALEAKHGKREGLEKYLRRRALTMEGLRKSIRARVYADEYLKQQGVLDPFVSDDRVRRMYQGNPDNYRREESVRLSHVLIAADERADAETKATARRKAEQIRAEILSGKDFAEFARKHSNCNSAAGGGDLGFVKRGYMPKEFDRVAFALDKGAVSELVQTKFGYHVLKVVDKKPAGVAPYEEVRDLIRKYLQSQDSKTRFSTHVAELRKKAKIEILLK